MKNIINKIKSKFRKSVSTVKSVVAEKRAEGYAGLYAYDEDETEELLIYLQNVLESEKDEKQKKEAMDGSIDGRSAH